MKLRLLATVIIGALLLAAVLAVATRQTGAQGRIDLSGSEWRIDVVGDVQITCTASIIQAAAAISVHIVCPPLGEGDINGTIDQRSGAFTVSGQLDIYGISLTGTAAADSQSFTGTWDAGTFGSGTLTGSRTGPGTKTATPILPTLPAPVDLSGAWRITFPSPLLGDCTLAIHEDSTLLTAIGECSGTDGGLRLNGTMDQTVGRLRLEEPDDFELEGTVSPNGNTMTGTYQVFSRPRAPFTAARDQSVHFIDLSGDWRLTLESKPMKECTLHIDQSFSQASAQFACPTVSDISIAGEVSPISGSFYLSDPNFHVENYFSGRSSSDGNYLVGELGFDIDTWNFTAVRQGRTVSGLVAMSEPGERAVGDPFTVQVRVADPPAGGYDSYHVGLAWKSERVSIDSIQARDCGTSSILIADPEHASIDCSSGANHDSTGIIAEFSVTCNRLGFATLDISGTTLSSPDGPSITPSVIGASIFCWTAGSSNPGDASCDGVVDSIDAALVLQHEAGILPLTGCLALADVNFDDEINAIDATLVLQTAAGLIPRLPVL